MRVSILVIGPAIQVAPTLSNKMLRRFTLAIFSMLPLLCSAGEAALHVAARKNDVAAIRELLAEGVTPLAHARLRHYQKIEAILLAANAV